MFLYKISHKEKTLSMVYKEGFVHTQSVTIEVFPETWGNATLFLNAFNSRLATQ